MTESIYSVKEAGVRIRESLILDRISLDIPEGSISTVIGPNGAGKTTFLNLLSRVIRPTSGKILYKGKEISKIPTKTIAKNVAVLPQMKHAVDGLTVEALVSFGRFPHTTPGFLQDKSHKAVIEWALEKTHTKHLRKRNVLSLSGGEQQRAWLGMALAQKPKVLVLDEPTAFLDIAYQLEILELIRSLNTENGITVVMVLHDLNHALRYSDNIVILKGGRILLAGRTEDTITTDVLSRYFCIDSDIEWDKRNNCPYIIPHRIVHHKEAP